MNVLGVVLSRYPPDHSGAALIFHRVANKLVLSNYANVNIIRFSNNLVPSYTIDNITVDTIRYRLPCHGYLLPFGAIEIICRGFFYLMHNRNIDVVHGISVNWTTLIFLFISKFFVNKTIIESTIIGDVIPPVGKSLKFLYKIKENIKLKILKGVDVCKVYSNALKEEFNSIGINNVTKIPPPIDVSIFYPSTPKQKHKLRDELNVPISCHVFLFCGVVGPRKGFDLVIESFIELQKNQSNIFLYVAGPL